MRLRIACATVFLLALACAPARAADIYAPFNGSCQQGGNQITVNGIQSQQYVQQSFPGCTVTVYSHGSLTLATIFSDGAGTIPLTNPFTATAQGVVVFYAANGAYDVQYSNAGIITPFTIQGVQLCFSCTGGGGGGGISGAGTAGFIPIWTGTSSIGNSALTDNGAGLLTYQGASPILTSSVAGGSPQLAGVTGSSATPGGAVILNGGAGSTTSHGGGIFLNAGQSLTDSLGSAPIELNGSNVGAGNAGSIFLSAGATTGTGLGGSIFLQPGLGTTNGVVTIGSGVPVQPFVLYGSITRFAYLATAPPNNPNTSPPSNGGAILWCQDCTGAADGATSGAIAAGSGTGAYVSYDGTNWRNFTGLGGSGGGSGNVTTTPTAGTNQFINQIPNSAGTQQSSFGANIFNNVVYAPPLTTIGGATAIAVSTTGFNWLQSPTGTISAGSNTVTLPNGCPSGIMTAASSQSLVQNWTYVYIAGTGTAEAVLVTATTCPIYGGGASGTITFTAANSHSAGFTVGSASQGLQETINSSLRCLSGRGCTALKGAASVVISPGDYVVKARVTAVPYDQMHLDFSGAYIICQVSDTCLFVGDTVRNDFGTNVTISHITFYPAIANGNFTAIEDNGQGLLIDGFGVGPNTAVAFSSFGHLVQVDHDEAAIITHMNTGAPGGGAWGHCSTDFCTSAIYLPSSSPEPLASVLNSNLSMGCKGNAIDNPAGNTLRIASSQIQAVSQFSVRSRGATANSLDVQSDDVYVEVGGCTNPLGTGIAGYVLNSGYSVFNGGIGPAGVVQKFVNAGTTGTRQYNYYLVVKSGANASTPYYIGYALSDGTAGNVTVNWSEVGATGTITYDILRTTGTTAFAPYTAIMGGGSATAGGSVTTAVTTGSCSNAVCTYTDSTTASTSSYTVLTTPSYEPDISGYASSSGPLPGNLVLAGAENTAPTGQTIASITFPYLAGGTIDSQNPPQASNSVAAGMYPTVFAGACQTGGLWSPLWIKCDSSSAVGYGARLVQLNTAPASGSSVYGTQGPLNFTPGAGSTLQGSHIITLLNSHPEITLTDPSATLYRQTPWNATDSYIAIDNTSGGVALTAASLALGNNVSISDYIGSNPDGTSWKRRLTSTTDTFKVPLTFSGTAFAFNSPEVSAPSSPASGTQSCYASAGNGLACKNSAGTVFTMTPPGSGTNYQTVQNAGSALPPEPSLNMIITGGACVDNPGSTRTDCTVPGAGTVTTFSAGNLSPLFTSSVATATTTPALTFSLTNAGGGTVFGRNASSSGAPSYTIAPVLGIPGTSTGTLGLAGATSGTAIITPQAASGSPTLTLPNISGTFAVSATSPLVLSATTGTLTAPTVVTATALTNQRIPVASGAQALVDSCLTSNGTQVQNTCTGGFIAGPASAANMIMSGTASNTDFDGEITLSGGAGTYSFVGTYTSRPECFFRDITTPANAVTTQTVTTTTITLAGTGTDVIGYACFGRN